MIGKLKDLLPLSGGEWLISLITREDPRQLFDELKDHAVKVEIKKASKHRSQDANAYCWVLIDLITSKLQDTDPKGKWTPEKVYRNAIKEIGGISEIYGVKEEAFERFKEIWIGKHIGRQVEILPGSSKAGWLNVKAWLGSSDFDSKQMSRLIDSLVQDAEALGIPTISDEEAERMVAQWGARASCKKATSDASSVAE